VLEKAGARILAARLALSDQIYSTRNLWIDVFEITGRKAEGQDGKPRYEHLAWPSSLV